MCRAGVDDAYGAYGFDAPSSDSDVLIHGALIMSLTETLEPPPANLLDGVPPDERVVIIDVTWDDYESL